MHYSTSLLVGCAGAAAAYFLYRRLVKRKVGYSYPVNQVSDGEFRHQLTMRIPRGSIGIILGRQGRNVQLIQFETGAHIRVYQYDCEVRKRKSREFFSLWGRHDCEEDWIDAEETEEKKGAAFGFVQIQAPTMEQAQLAVMKIKSMVADWRRHCASTTIKVPRDAIGYVIGRFGKNIKSIGYVCRTRIRIINESDDYEEFEIAGSEVGVAAALERIENSIDRYYRMHDHFRGANNDATGNGEGTSAAKPESRGDLYEDVALELDQIVKLREELEADEEMW